VSCDGFKKLLLQVQVDLFCASETMLVVWLENLQTLQSLWVPVSGQKRKKKRNTSVI
jgi:hypothetical protein